MAMKNTRLIARALAVSAATAGLMLAGSAVASAQTTQVDPDPSCLQEGAEAFLADPVGVLSAAAHDPVATAHAEIACVEEVLGL